MNFFSPKLDILPGPQKKLWPELTQVPRHFVLYGGTAIALRLNHRHSVDFDFFSSQGIDTDKLLSEIDFLYNAQVLQQEKDTLTVLVERNGPVKLSFFGAIKVGRMANPEITQDGNVLVASIQDLLAHKLKVLLQRVDVKDYSDIAAILKTNESLAQGLSGAKAMWPNIPIMECLRAMCYFEGADFRSLSNEDRQILINSSTHFSPEQIKKVDLYQPLSPFSEGTKLDPYQSSGPRM